MRRSNTANVSAHRILPCGDTSVTLHHTTLDYIVGRGRSFQLRQSRLPIVNLTTVQLQTPRDNGRRDICISRESRASHV